MQPLNPAQIHIIMGMINDGLRLPDVRDELEAAGPLSPEQLEMAAKLDVELSDEEFDATMDALTGL